MKIRQLVFLTVLFGLVACGSNEPVDKLETAAPKVVAWLSLSRPEVAVERLLSGQVSAAERTRLSFQAQGQIDRIKVKVGQRFSAGQTLAVLDKTNYRLQLQQATANLNTAVAQRNQAQIEVQRRAELVKTKVIPKAQLDSFRLQLTSAEQAIKAAEAQLQLVKKQLKDTDLIAPFDGSITAKLAEVGQLVSSSVPIFSVETSQLPEVSFSIPETMRADVAIGQAVAVTFVALPAVEVSGTVAEISAQAQLGAFPAKLALDNPPAVIKAGMTAELRLLVNQGDDMAGFRIPPSALAAGENNRHFVYRIVEESGQWSLQKVAVQVSSLSDSDLIVQGDLRAGDKLVRSGMGFLHPNQSVLLMGEGAKRINP